MDPLIDHGCPTFFVVGKEATYLGNGMIEGAYYRIQKIGNETARVVECRLVFHVQDLPAMRRQTNIAVQLAFGNERALM